MATCPSHRDSAALKAAEEALREAERVRVHWMEQANAELRQRERLLQAVNAAARVLLAQGDFDRGVGEALALLGAASEADRVALARHLPEDGNLVEGGWEVTNEWNRAQIPRQMDDTARLGRHPSQDMLACLRAGESQQFYAGRLPEKAEHREIFLEEGTRSTLIVPILVAGRNWGVIGFDDCTSERTWAPHEVAIFETFAACLAAALERRETESRRLTSERALLEEREARLHVEQRRAAELAEANAILRRSLGRLADDDNLGRFFAELLKEAVAVAGAAGGAIFEHDVARDLLIMRAHVLDGELCDLERDPRNEPFREFIVAAQDPVWRDLCRKRAVVTIGVNEPGVFGLPTIADWHRARGHRTIFALPLLLGERPIGLLGLAFRREEDQPVAARFSVVSALAQQAALALRLDQFAEQAAAAAIAREHEHVAVARAAVLARANNALRRSSTSLVAQEDLGRFLGALMGEAVLLSGAKTAGVFAYDETTECLRMVACLSEGVLIDISNDPEMEIWRQPVPINCSREWVRRLSSVEILSFKTAVPENQHPWPVSREWHLRRGHLEVVDLPLFAGGKLVGCFGHCFAEPDWRPHFDTEQLRVFANHAALALQLARLAERTKAAATESAVLIERNRLARDLHDTLAQGLTGVLTQLGAAEGAVESGRADRAGHYLERARMLARFSLAEARASVHALRPETNEGPLCDRLRRMITTMTQGTDLSAQLAEHGRAVVLRPAVDWCVHKFVQEALANAVKHSGAAHFAATLRWEHDRLHVIASDDGCGFDQARVRPGLGLAAMKERADEIGGVFRNDSQVGQGCRLVLEIPYIDR